MQKGKKVIENVQNFNAKLYIVSINDDSNELEQKVKILNYRFLMFDFLFLIYDFLIFLK